MNRRGLYQPNTPIKPLLTLHLEEINLIQKSTSRDYYLHKAAAVNRPVLKENKIPPVEITKARFINNTRRQYLDEIIGAN